MTLLNLTIHSRLNYVLEIVNSIKEIISRLIFFYQTGFLYYLSGSNPLAAEIPLMLQSKAPWTQKLLQYFNHNFKKVKRLTLEHH
jgi:hypothetical protein